MTFDEQFLKEVDRIVKKKHTNRSAFTGQAPAKSIKEEKIKEQIKGYMRKTDIQDELTLINDNKNIWDEFNDTW